MGNKNPFERIVSLLDRKRIFLKLISQKTPVILKMNDGALASFRGLEVSKEGANLDGLANEKAFAGAKQRVVVVFFYSGRERYFIRTKIMKLPTGMWRIMNSPEFYRLNRRDAHRTVIPESISLYLYVTSIDGASANTKVRISDFSATGVRVRWTGRDLPAKGSLLKANLMWLKGKEFQVFCRVKHLGRDGSLGLEFIELGPVQTSRFKILSVELQQIVNFAKP